jgi:outer membrane protein assembly factor BamD (BamD/ComL family)
MRNLLFLLLITIVSLAGFTACKKKETAADRQAKAAQAFRDRQKIGAIKAYTALVTDYPESEYVPKAQERLTVLGPLPAATPAPKK